MCGRSVLIKGVSYVTMPRRNIIPILIGQREQILIYYRLEAHYARNDN